MGTHTSYKIPAEMVCPKCGSHDALRSPTPNEAQLLIDGTLDPWRILGRSAFDAGMSIVTKGLVGAWKDLDRHETMREFAILRCDSCRSDIIVCPGCLNPAIAHSRPLNEHLAWFCHDCREESH